MDVVCLTSGCLFRSDHTSSIPLYYWLTFWALLGVCEASARIQGSVERRPDCLLLFFFAKDA